jgi:hypothetical protein
VGIQSPQFSDGKRVLSSYVYHDANQRSCLSTSTIAKQAVAKQTSRLLYDHDDLGDDVDASVRAVLDGTETTWE